MISTILITSIIINIILTAVLYSSNEEKPIQSLKTIYKDKIIYVEKPIEKIVYKSKIKYKDKIVYVEKPIEKIVYVEKIVEKVVYKNKPTVHEFIEKEEPKVSKERQELIDTLAELKNKKKKTKKDQENIYTIEKILPNIK
jgi:hypothetical protein